MTELVLQRQQIESLIGFDSDSLDAVESAFRWIGEGRVAMPPVMHIDVPDHRGAVDIKSAYVRGISTLAVKIGAGYSDNRLKGLPSSPAMVVVLDAETGIVSAVLLDDAYLTDLRTGLAGAVAAKYLSRLDAHRVGIVGAGVQARFQLRALRLVRDIRSVAVWSRSSEMADKFVGEIERETGLAARSCSIAELCRDSDIVVTTTPSTSALIEQGHLHPGLHVTAVGSDLPGKRELAPAVLQQAATLACDDVAQSQRLGELQGVELRALRSLPVSLAEVIARGRVPMRSDADVTIADLSGLGVQDTAIAHEVLRRLSARSAKIPFPE
jgi:ornithine cyclodeaminase/alanine dehydrogenase-like protein (mu-crystallin family)